MRNVADLEQTLGHIDGRGYKAYREIRGAWSFPHFQLHVDHVQGDPFAAPSRLRAIVPAEVTRLPQEECRPGSRAVGVGALLARRFASEARRVARHRGSGKSGSLSMESPGQEVLPQTAVRVDRDGAVEARFTAGLPAAGRRILGRQAAYLLTQDVPAVLGASLLASALNEDTLRKHARVNEDADALRGALGRLGLIAFIADGATLPRRTGVDERPLDAASAVLFRSATSLRVTISLPNAGEVSGMGIPKGVTLIVGGGFHGKSTVLRTLERGVYNHRPGDGRELAVSDPGTVKVRAEDGRSVTGVDISPFISNLPRQKDTWRFSTPNASGSTSQAASIMEALESGARVLLIDEDTAATNFMIRDRRMQALVPKAAEPITPFVDRVRALYDQHGVSSVLVLGGSGDYLDVADTVVAMQEYVPHHVTERARAISAEWPTGRIREATSSFAVPPPRIPLPRSLDPSRGRKQVSVKVRDGRRIDFGSESIDLSTVDQIVSRAQTEAIAAAMVLARQRILDGHTPLPDILQRVMEIVAQEGLDALDHRRRGDLAAFRPFELASALNRIRSLQVAG
jgi:predicted ABC-class ATPase